jgi:hypothetical protein
VIKATGDAQKVKRRGLQDLRAVQNKLRLHCQFKLTDYDSRVKEEFNHRETVHQNYRKAVLKNCTIYSTEGGNEIWRSILVL